MTQPSKDSADMATEPQPTKNKRTAERQITKDDEEDTEDDNGHPMDKTVKEPTGTFQKADEATLAARKIVKVKRPTVAEGSDDVKKNPFAAGLSKGGGTVFGSGFGGFGSMSGGFGFGSTATTGTAFGSAFGGGTDVSAFGATPVGGSIFGKQNAEGATSGFSTSAFAPPPQPVLPQDVEVSNGEEGESLVHEVRAKTFELVKEEEVLATNASEGPIPASSSAPPTSATASTVEDTPEEETENKAKDSAESKPEEVANPPGDTTTTEESVDEAKLKWREVGIGPLRVLKKERARIVQRRETAPGSLGTKLLVNIQLHHDCSVTRPSDKHVQLGTMMSGKTASFLFKVKHAMEAEALQQLFQSEIDEAKSCVGA